MPTHPGSHLFFSLSGSETGQRKDVPLPVADLPEPEQRERLSTADPFSLPPTPVPYTVRLLLGTPGNPGVLRYPEQLATAVK